MAKTRFLLRIDEKEKIKLEKIAIGEKRSLNSLIAFLIINKIKEVENAKVKL